LTRGKLQNIMTFIPQSLLILLFFCQNLHISEMAVARGLVKPGDDFVFDNVPGRILVMRQTKVYAQPQYLWAGNQDSGWTTDGVNSFIKS